MNRQQQQDRTELVAALPYFDITPDLFAQFERMAVMMASATVAVPEHFRGKPGNCFAVIAQAWRWRMDPYAVASKTHITKGGLMGYDGQLVSAVVTTLAPIRSRPAYEYLGDWSRVLGKVKEQKSEKSGGSYYVATYTPDDEEGLGVVVRATFIDETVPREIITMMAQAYPRFSTQWATDPQQQIGYLAIRKWARRYTPDVLLGVYTPEELMAREVHDMGSVDEVPSQSEPRTTGSRTDDVKSRMKKNAPPKLDDVLKAIENAGDAVALTKAGELAMKLANEMDKETARKAYADKLHASKTPKPATVSFAEVADQMRAATDRDALDVAADLIKHVSDDQQRIELGEMYSTLASKYEADPGEAS
jgi:hypothetical protein